MPGRNIFHTGGLAEGLHPLIGLRARHTSGDPFRDAVSKSIEVHQRMRKGTFPHRHRAQDHNPPDIDGLDPSDCFPELVEIIILAPHRMKQDDLGDRRFDEAKHELTGNWCTARCRKASEAKWNSLLSFSQSRIERRCSGIAPQKQKGLVTLVNAVRIELSPRRFQKALVAESSIVLRGKLRDIADFRGKAKAEAGYTG